MSWDSEIRRVFLFSDGVGDGCVLEGVDRSVFWDNLVVRSGMGWDEVGGVFG
jgi:hypothetical protein